MSKRHIEYMVERMGGIVGEMQTLHFRYTEHGNRGWQPLMNVYGYPKHYEICVELAGVAAEDLRIRVEGRRVAISGVRHWPDLRCKSTGSRCRRTTLMEIEEGPFAREIELPEAVDGNSAEIRSQNGLVWILLKIL